MEKIITVNIVSDLDDFRWLPLVKLRPKIFSYIFSKKPVKADFHVVYHIKTKMEIPNNRNRLAFVISEPPEIEVIKLKFLKQFGLVLTPEFDYLRDLPNIKFCGGLLPWQAGFSFDHRKVTQNKSLDELVSSWASERPILLSVITSDKKLTPQQKQRLDFITFLKSQIEGVEIFGRGFNEIDDKADILLKSQYHLAIENSSHNGYWTEKFIDPLICGTQIIYVGDKNLSNLFESYIPIDLDDFEIAKEAIIEAINAKTWDTRASLRKRDYINYTTNLNLFCIIEEWASSQSQKRFDESIILKSEMGYLQQIIQKLKSTKLRLFQEVKRHL